MPKKDPEKCFVCEKEASTRCTNCQIYYYCSKECQKIHWKSKHSKHCQRLSKLCKLCLKNDPFCEHEQGICSDCGEIYCGECIRAGKPAQVIFCPYCRKCFIDRIDEKAFQNLLNLEKRAEAGDKRLQKSKDYLFICIAGRYLKGCGVEKSIEKAAEYYKKTNSPLAFFNLWCLEEDDHPKAIEYLKKASEGGYSKAQYIYALKLKQDNKDSHTQESIDFLKKAALSGYPDAEFELGLAFQLGLIPGDEKERPEKSIFWYNRAAEKNHGGAYNNLGVIYKNGLGIIGDMEKAKTYFEKSHILGNKEGTFGLGTIYEEDREFKIAMNYYRLAAEKDFPPAFHQMALIILRKQFAIRDIEKERSKNVEDALNFMKRGANLGCRSSQSYISRLQEAMGDGNPPLIDKWLIWERFFAEN